APVAWVDERLEELGCARLRAASGDGELLLRQDADAEGPSRSDRARARRLRAERDEDCRRLGGDRSEGGDGHPPGPVADPAGDERDAARERAHGLDEVRARRGLSRRIGDELECRWHGLFFLCCERLAAACSEAANRCRRGQAVATSTVTGTPFVTMSKTAERCCARATTSRSFSSGASPATRKETRIRSKPLRYSSERPSAPCTSMSPSSVDSTSVRRTPRAAAMYTIDVVRQAASACSRYSAGFGPVSVPNRIADSPASITNSSSRDVSSWLAA